MDWLPISFWVFAAVAFGGAGLTALMAMGIGIPEWLGTSHGMVALALLFTINLGLGATLPALAGGRALVVFLVGFVRGRDALLPRPDAGQGAALVGARARQRRLLGLCLFDLAAFAR